MAKIDSLSKELVSNHTTEEIVGWLSTQAKGLVAATRSADDTDGRIIRNWANAEMLFSVVAELDKKLNGNKEPTVL